MSTAVKKCVTIDISKMSGDLTGTQRYLLGRMNESFEAYFEKHEIDPSYFGQINFAAIDPHRGGDPQKLIKRATLPNPYNKPGFVVSVYTEGTQGVKGFMTATTHEDKLQTLIYDGRRPAKAPPKSTKAVQATLEDIPQVAPPTPAKSVPKDDSKNEVPLMKKLEELKKLTEEHSIRRTTLKDEIASIEELLPRLEQQVRDAGEAVLAAQAKHERTADELNQTRIALLAKRQELSQAEVPKDAQDEIRKIFEQASELARMAGIVQ